MLLTFVVLSYNRPDTLERILSHFNGFSEKDVSIVIKDDDSPDFLLIEKIVNKYKNTLEIPLTLTKNKSNIGYDLNLLDSFEKIDSEYLFFLSDDDYVKVSRLNQLISVLKQREHNIYFTPYLADGVENRFVEPIYSPGKIADVIYNSVLISGLIFNKKAVAALKIDKQYFAQAIYTQVYLSTMTVLKDEAYGTAPSGILEVGGDGENFFGKNQSATNRDLISDRKQISSDLNYQQFLLRVVDRISVDSGKEISKLFWKNYSKRLLGYGFKARSLGLSKYKVFLKAYFN